MSGIAVDGLCWHSGSSSCNTGIDRNEQWWKLCMAAGRRLPWRKNKFWCVWVPPTTERPFSSQSTGWCPFCPKWYRLGLGRRGGQEQRGIDHSWYLWIVHSVHSVQVAVWIAVSFADGIGSVAQHTFACFWTARLETFTFESLVALAFIFRAVSGRTLTT